MCSVLTDPKTTNIRPINTVHQEKNSCKSILRKKWNCKCLTLNERDMSSFCISFLVEKHMCDKRPAEKYSMCVLRILGSSHVSTKL